MTKKSWLAALACASLMLSACGNKENHTESNSNTQSDAERTYVVGTNAEFAPFEAKDANGQLEGFDIDLIQAMAKAGNFKITFKDQPWDSLFASLNNGDFDLLASAVTITDDRKKTMEFSEPYFEITQVVLVPEDKHIQSVEDLKNMNRIGVVTGNTGDLAAQKILGATSPKIARFESLPLVIKEVESGGVDAVISDSAVIGNYIKNNSSKNFTTVTVPDFEVEHYGLVVRKDNTELQQKLNDALKKVRESGEYDKIFHKYFK